MREMHEILREADGVDQEVAEELYRSMEEHLELPHGYRVHNLSPYESGDQSGGWVIAEIDLDGGEQASIYALDGGVLLQMYDGEKFRDPVDNIGALNQQTQSL